MCTNPLHSGLAPLTLDLPSLAETKHNNTKEAVMKFGQIFLSPLIGIVGMGATFSAPLQLSEVSSSPVSEVVPTQRPADSGQPGVWPAPTFSAVDQDGKRVTDQDLRGHVWVAA